MLGTARADLLGLTAVDLLITYCHHVPGRRSSGPAARRASVPPPDDHSGQPPEELEEHVNDPEKTARLIGEAETAGLQSDDRALSGNRAADVGTCPRKNTAAAASFSGSDSPPARRAGMNAKTASAHRCSPALPATSRYCRDVT